MQRRKSDGIAAIPNRDREIYRVSLQLQLDGVRRSFECDLIFLDHVPHAVLEWEGSADSHRPVMQIRLEVALLEIDPRDDGKFIYAGKFFHLGTN